MKKKIFTIITLVIITIGLLIALIVNRMNNLNKYTLKENEKAKITCDKANIESRTIDKTLANNKVGTLNIYIPESLYKEDNEQDNDANFYDTEYGYQSETIYEISIHEGITNVENKLITLGKDKEIDATKLLKENKINNEIDVIKSLKNSNSNIFTPVNKMQFNYLIRSYALDMYCDEKDIIKEGETTLVISKNTGDKYSNYIYEISAYKNNKLYLINITENKTNEKSKVKITEEEINKIISSIYID